MSKLSEEDMAVLRRLKGSNAWQLMVRLGQSVKGDFLRGANARSFINGHRNVDDSDRLIALGSAQGVDGFLNFLESAIAESEKDSQKDTDLS
tara:strand:- start:18777 stop:19052 length:276 start_codon:yes stop_codon:yes gene_type:complete